MKRCSKCGIEKDESEFSKDKSRKDGLQKHCKKCHKKYREKNKEKLIDQKKEYYKNNKGKIKYRNVNIRRNMMIRILENYHNKEFTYDEVRVKLNDSYNEEGFYQHFEYLVNNNFIEKTSDITFKFCDRVKKWRAFGQL